jgi:peptide/nickel transport system substrate-binding protein
MILNKHRMEMLFSILFIIALGLTACGNPNQNLIEQGNTSNPTTVAVTPTAIPQKTLVICLGEEPQSLYLYANSSRAMWSVLEAIYDGPIDTMNFLPSPVILNSIPTVENGGVVIQSISVTAGDEVANVDGDIVTLEKGVKVFPEGCTSLDCATEWDGKSDLRLSQMAVKYQLLDGLKWSDGQPLSADDSLYSYELAKDPASKVSKISFGRTDSYQVIDSTTVQWTGKPGYLTMNPASYFWIPQPRHLYKTLTAEQLNTSEVSNKKPVGWGPYMIDEWVANDHIRLVKNPEYFRTSEGLPKFDVLVYRFVPANPEPDLSPMVTGECDLMDTSVGLETQIQPVRELENAGKLKTYFAQGPEWELINFGIKPASYDDVYNPYLDRQDIFGDLRVRQAFAYCIDRPKIVSEVLFSQSKIPLTYLPPNHPYLASNLTDYPYDPLKGNQLLDEVGWKDLDANPDTPRQSEGVDKVLNGTDLAVTYSVTDSVLHNSVVQVVVDSLKQCGVSVTPQLLSVGDMYASGPTGTVFGRNFDLAELAWSTGRQPPCFLFSSTEIPTEKNSWLGTKFGGVNLTGYSNPAYDEACTNMLESGLDKAAFDQNNQVTQHLIADDLPVLPLFYHIKAMVSRIDLCGLTLDVSSRSPLDQIESLDISSDCVPKK